MISLNIHKLHKFWIIIFVKFSMTILIVIVLYINLYHRKTRGNPEVICSIKKKKKKHILLRRRIKRVAHSMINDFAAGN